MEVRIEKKRFYTDQERYEWCRKCKLSGMPVTTFARKVMCMSIQIVSMIKSELESMISKKVVV